MDASRKCVMATSRHRVTYLELRNESMISRARNTLLAQFLTTDNDWLYFWDDDIETSNIGGPDGNLIDMLLSHGKEFVGGLYSTRGLGGHCAARAIEGVPATGRLWEIEYLAGGSIMVSREVIDAMCRAFHETQYTPRTNEGTAGQAWALFQPFTAEGEYLSEDFAFCERWRSEGGRVYADLDVRLWHWGEAPFGLADPRGNA